MQKAIVDEEALRLLACPVCHAALTLLPVERVVLCTGCGRRYPVRDGLPVLLASAAQQSDTAPGQ